MSIRNKLKAALLAVTAGASLLLALPSQAHERPYCSNPYSSHRGHGGHHDHYRGHHRHGGYRHEHYRGHAYARDYRDDRRPPRYPGQRDWSQDERRWDGDRRRDY